MDFILSGLFKILDVLKTFSWLDALDIIIIALLIFGFIKLIRETRAEQLVKGIFILLAIWLLATQLHLKMLNSLLGNVFEFSVLAVLMIFQPEIRRALEQIGRANVGGYIGSVNVSEAEDIQSRFDSSITQICKACSFFSKTKTGALIIFERNTKLKEIANTGTYINADVSQELIGNIFFNKAPLHDGAIIIRNSSILAAGCILPLTKNIDISSNLGTRHRAAIGMSENSDAVALVVSEETGTISIAVNGTMTRNYSEKTLKNELTKLIYPASSENFHPKKNIFFLNRRKKNED